MLVDTSRDAAPTPEESAEPGGPPRREPPVPSIAPAPPADASADVHPTFGEPPSSGPVARLGARLVGAGDGLPRLRTPPPPHVPQLRRSGLAAWWSARRAAAGLDDFLRHRLTLYLARSGIGRERLPVEIAIDAGRIVMAPRESPPAAGTWFAQYVRAHGEPSFALDLRRARMEMAHAEARLREASDRLRPARADLDAASRAPSLGSPDGDDVDRPGRPSISAPWGLAIGGFVAALVLTDASHLALPLLRGAGVRPEEIALEASRRPLAVALPLALALGASASLFVFVAAAMRRARSVLDALPARWHAVAHGLAGGASLGVAFGLAWAVFGAGRSAAGPVASCVLAVTLPVATPALLDLARRLDATRAQAIRAARAWDQEHRAALARWNQARALVSFVEQECAAHEAARAAWAQRFHALRKRAAAAARLAVDALEAEASELCRLSDALVAALELDRQAYLSARPRLRPVETIEGGACARDTGRPSSAA